MEYRTLGKTGMTVSRLGFGCGAVGGLMVRGAPSDQERAVARAVELGISYFDTAAFYGMGESEKNLGRVLKALRPNVHVGTKVMLRDVERTNIATTVAASLDASLKRLQREQVDLLQLHNDIGGPNQLTADTVLNEVVPAFERARLQGKIRFLGLSAKGDTQSVHRAVDSGRFDTAQVIYNMLNPSAGAALPLGFPGQDFGCLFEHTKKAHVGTIIIRVLAGGALSGNEERHPLGSASIEPMASAADYRTDVRHAQLLEPLVRDGHVQSLVEASLRFAISNEDADVILIGLSTLEQLEAASAAVNKGPLSPAALARVAEIEARFESVP
jgi:aryl-alcohol dehydrogenase-like predicted oxidoreductase